jgi:ABC-type lipoprotein export system ATPase subunit
VKKKKEAIISAKNLKKSFTTKDRSQDIFDQLAVFRRKNCGFVFQQIYLLENMSLMDNVITAGALVNKNRKEITKKASELFEIIYVFLTIFLYLLKCPQSLIL